MLTIGISLKAYFGYRQTVEWCEAIGALAVRHPAVGSSVRLVVMPAFPALRACVEVFAQTPVEVGAQAISPDGPGAHTGEVPGALLYEVGCRYAEIGHAERRRWYGETPEIVRQKVRAAASAGLVPWLCVGETTRGAAALAIQETAAQLEEAALQPTGRGAVVAYEPVWAIGQDEPADPDHVRAVCTALRDRGIADTSVIYGGSAGPGTLARLYPAVSGLFLGRFAHEPARVRDVLDEAAALAAQPNESVQEHIS
jgi:triosephosphate isomerase (TIM)